MQISILIFLLIVFTIELFFIYKNKWINSVLALLIIIATFQWYYLPAILTISGFNIVLQVNENNLEDLYKLMIKEFIFYQIILFFFLISENKIKIKFISLNLKESVNTLRIQNSLFFISIIIIGYNIFYIFQNKMNYETNNDISQQQGGVFQIISLLSNFFISFLWVYYIFEENKSKLKYYISLILISGFSLTLILSGSRIYFLSFIFLFIFSLKKSKNNWKKIRIMILLLFVSGVSLLLLPVLSSKRIEGAREVKIGTALELVPQELNIKLNSFSYSETLLKYDGKEFAGFNPYIGSFLKFVPRFIWNDKPTATSFNSDITGIPSRRIPYLQGSESDSYNVGTSAFAVSLWQMGYLTVFIAIILNVFFLKILNRLLNKDGLILKSIAFMMLAFPQLVMFPTYGDNIIQVIELAAIITLFFLFIGYLKLERSENSNI